MIKFRTFKNSYARLKENYTRIITGEEAWSKYMDRIIEEAEENLKNGGGTITLQEWREHMRRKYNIVL